MARCHERYALTDKDGDDVNVEFVDLAGVQERGNQLSTAHHPGMFSGGRAWKLSSILTIGSGHPVDAKVFGDPNQDGNDSNDRLPSSGRNASSVPDYATTDLRLWRRLYVRPRCKLELVAGAFNALNRDNQLVVIADDGFTSTATNFVQLDKTIGIKYFPPYYQKPADLTGATSAYAPRQMQFALKVIFGRHLGGGDSARKVIFIAFPR